MEIFTVFVVQLFCSTTKGILLNCIPILFLKYFMSRKKASCNVKSLELHTPSYLQPIIYSVTLSFFNSNILNVG